MTERKQAIELANRVLDRVSADPDDDLAVLARQLILATERNKALEGALEQHHRWHMDCDEPDSYAVPDGKGGWVGLNRAEEYAESSLFDLTIKALKGSEIK